MRKNKLLTIWAVLVFAFLAIPLLIITVTAFGGGSAITFPIESFSLKWFANVFALKSFRRSFITSLEVAFMATFISLLVGIPAAYALARSGMKGRGLLKSIFLSPTIVPGIVIGFIMYQCLILTLRIPVFTGLLAGHFMVTLPYVIRVVGSSMEQFDFSIEEAAWYCITGLRTDTCQSNLYPHSRGKLFPLKPLSYDFGNCNTSDLRSYSKDGITGKSTVWPCWQYIPVICKNLISKRRRVRH